MLCVFLGNMNCYERASILAQRLALLGAIRAFFVQQTSMLAFCDVFDENRPHYSRRRRQRRRYPGTELVGLDSQPNAAVAMNDNRCVIGCCVMFLGSAHVKRENRTLRTTFDAVTVDNLKKKLCATQ